MTVEVHLAYIQKNFDPVAELLDSDAAVPNHWLGYLESDPAKRRQTVIDEFTLMADYLPNASAGIMRVATDGFLVHSPRRGLCRFLVRQFEDDAYLAFSRCPTAFCTVPSNPAYDLLKQNGDEIIRWIYAKRMDGLVDIWDLGGLLPSDRLNLFSENIADWGERDWYDGFVAANDPSKFVEVFSSGGGAYFIIDLTERPAANSSPPAFTLSTDNSDMNPNAPWPFWSRLDAWTAIGLADD